MYLLLEHNIYSAMSRLAVDHAGMNGRPNLTFVLPSTPKTLRASSFDIQHNDHHHETNAAKKKQQPKSKHRACPPDVTSLTPSNNTTTAFGIANAILCYHTTTFITTTEEQTFFERFLSLGYSLCLLTNTIESASRK